MRNCDSLEKTDALNALPFVPACRPRPTPLRCYAYPGLPPIPIQQDYHHLQPIRLLPIRPPDLMSRSGTPHQYRRAPQRIESSYHISFGLDASFVERSAHFISIDQSSQDLPPYASSDLVIGTWQVGAIRPKLKDPYCGRPSG